MSGRSLGLIAAMLLVGSLLVGTGAPTAASPFEARVLVKGLTNPAAITVDQKGTVYVGEENRLLAIVRGKSRVVAYFPAWITGLTWHEDRLYVAYIGGIAEALPTGATHTLVTDLPSYGDHANYQVVVGPDRWLYFGQGTATNAGVVGLDNEWRHDLPKTHDVPCQTLTLRGPNFTTTKPTESTTGAFMPYGKTTARAQQVKGQLPCSGAILRVRPDGSGLSLVAWGLRDPRGLAVGPDGLLWATVRGFEDRGSRPVTGDRDHLYRIEPGQWYGWPDFAGGLPVSETAFQKSSMPAPILLLEPPTTKPPRPVASFAREGRVAGVLFPPASWKMEGEAIVAQSGSGPKIRGQLLRVTTAGGSAIPLLPPGISGPAHPLALAAGPRGELYVTDVGEFDGTDPKVGEGMVWQISPRQKRLSMPVLPGSPISWGLCGTVLAVQGARLLLVRRD